MTKNKDYFLSKEKQLIEEKNALKNHYNDTFFDFRKNFLNQEIEQDIQIVFRRNKNNEVKFNYLKGRDISISVTFFIQNNIVQNSIDIQYSNIQDKIENFNNFNFFYNIFQQDMKKFNENHESIKNLITVVNNYKYEKSTINKKINDNKYELFIIENNNLVKRVESVFVKNNNELFNVENIIELKFNKLLKNTPKFNQDNFKLFFFTYKLTEQGISFKTESVNITHYGKNEEFYKFKNKKIDKKELSKVFHDSFCINNQFIEKSSDLKKYNIENFLSYKSFFKTFEKELTQFKITNF